MSLRTLFHAFLSPLLLSLYGAQSCSAQVTAAEPWICLKTDRLELLTTNSEPAARAMLRTLQEADSFFQKLYLPEHPTEPGKETAQRPIHIFAFKSKAEYAKVRLSNGAFGHYIHGRRDDFIALEDIQPRHYQAGVHEFAHLAIRRAGLKLPVWLNEGLADVYSSMTPEADRVVVGGVLKSRAAALDQYAWLDLEAMFRVVNEQALYRSRCVPIFYAQSWLLAHMLAFDPRYQAALPQFLKAISSGVGAAQVFQEVYGASTGEVMSDLQDYWHKRLICPVAFVVRLPEMAQPSVSSLDSLQSSLALAELLGATAATSEQAEHLLRDLLNEFPTEPRIGEQLAELAQNRQILTNDRGAEERASVASIVQQ